MKKKHAVKLVIIIYLLLFLSQVGLTAGNTISGLASITVPNIFSTEIIDRLTYIKRVDKDANINSAKRTWLIIHGLANSSREDWIEEITADIIRQLPNDQVLVLDWSTTAKAEDGWLVSQNAEHALIDVATWATKKLKDAGFVGRNLNLIGHSYGGNISGEIAKLIPYTKNNSTNRVNSIVALDPAMNGFDLQSKLSISKIIDGTGFFKINRNIYNPNESINFKKHSNYSLCIHSSWLGSQVTPGTAHEAFYIDYDRVNLPDPRDRHTAAYKVFSYFQKINSETSKWFKYTRIIKAAIEGSNWPKDQFNNHRATYKKELFHYPASAQDFENVIAYEGNKTKVTSAYFTNGIEIKYNGVVINTPNLLTGYTGTDFGQPLMGIDLLREYDITNKSQTDITILTATISDGYSIINNPSNKILKPNESIPLVVKMDTSSIGEKKGFLTVNSTIEKIKIQIAGNVVLTKPNKPSLTSPLNRSIITNDELFMALGPYNSSTNTPQSQVQYRYAIGNAIIIESKLLSPNGQLVETLKSYPNGVSGAVQGRYKDTNGGWSEWSDAKTFTIMRQAPQEPAPTDPYYRFGKTGGRTAYSFANSADGGFYVVGDFEEINGLPARGIAKFDRNSNLDKTFLANTMKLQTNRFESIRAIIVQSDGRIILGGDHVGFGLNKPIVRINPDGNLDETYKPEINGYISSMALQPNGQLIIGGNGFSKNIARLNIDGSTDTIFMNGLTGFPDYPSIYAIYITSDDKIMIGGNFNKINGIERRHLCLLNYNGDLDREFLKDLSGPSTRIRSITKLKNGNFILTGALFSFNDKTVKNLVSIDGKGIANTDYSSTQYGSNNILDAYEIGSQVLISGNMIINNKSEKLKGLNVNGTLDNVNYKIEGGSVHKIGALLDGRIIICGSFDRVQNKDQQGFAILKNIEMPKENISIQLTGPSDAINEGLTATFTTTLKGDPGPYIGRWVKDGEIITSNSGRFAGNQILKISDLKYADKGLYHYEIQTQLYGTIKSNSVQLNVIRVNGKLEITFNTPEGRWREVGQTEWLTAGEYSLNKRTYNIEFITVLGYLNPEHRTFTITNDTTTVLNILYRKSIINYKNRINDGLNLTSVPALQTSGNLVFTYLDVAGCGVCVIDGDTLKVLYKKSLPSVEIWRSIGTAPVLDDKDNIFIIQDWNTWHSYPYYKFSPNLEIRTEVHNAPDNAHSRGLAINNSLQEIYTGSSTFIAMDTEFFLPKWYGSGRFIGAQSLVIDTNDIVYCVTYERGANADLEISAYDPHISGDNKRLWLKQFPRINNPYINNIAGFSANGNLLIECQDGIRSMNPKTGEFIQNWLILNSRNPVIGQNGIIYSNSTISSSIIATNESGETLWTKEVSTTSGFLLDFIAENDICVGRLNEQVIIVDHKNNHQYKISAKNTINRPLSLNHKGELIVFDDEERFLLTTTLKYADTCWAIAHQGNAQHTKKMHKKQNLVTQELSNSGDSEIQESSDSDIIQSIPRRSNKRKIRKRRNHSTRRSRPNF